MVCSCSIFRKAFHLNVEPFFSSFHSCCVLRCCSGDEPRAHSNDDDGGGGGNGGDGDDDRRRRQQLWHATCVLCKPPSIQLNLHGLSFIPSRLCLTFAGNHYFGLVQMANSFGVDQRTSFIWGCDIDCARDISINSHRFYPFTFVASRAHKSLFDFVLSAFGVVNQCGGGATVAAPAMYLCTSIYSSTDNNPEHKKVRTNERTKSNEEKFESHRQRMTQNNQTKNST